MSIGYTTTGDGRAEHTLGKASHHGFTLPRQHTFAARVGLPRACSKVEQLQNDHAIHTMCVVFTTLVPSRYGQR